MSAEIIEVTEIVEEESTNSTKSKKGKKDKKKNSSKNNTKKQNSKKKSNSNSLFGTKIRTSDNEPLPKTAQDTIPYINVFKSGIIETKPNFYTKAYQLEDINFSVAPEEDQEAIFDNYTKLLNSFDSKTKIQIVINNRNADEEILLNTILLELKGNKLDKYRIEMNEMLKSKMAEGRNNLISDKYIVLGSEFASYKDAVITFNRLDVEIDQQFKRVAMNQNVKTPPQNINERLKTLHDILNIGNEDELTTDFDIEELSKQGLTTKDLISPAGFKFDRDHFRMGDKFARVLCLKTLPSTLSTDFMQAVSDMPFNLLGSFYINPIEQTKALKLVQRNLQNIRANVTEAQMNAAKSGYSADLISPKLQHAYEQAEYLLDDMRDRDQKIFFFTGTIMHFADSKEELDQDTRSLKEMGNRYGIAIMPLLFQQEVGFRSTLPLCRHDVDIERLLTSEGVSIFIPFSTKEMLQDNGMYYGLNAVSKNLILYNRNTAKNQNGLILGQPGSGKSFSAKREMMNVILNTEDEIYIIDPESEYTYMVTEMGGAVIKIEAGSKVYINPLDMDINYSDGNDDGADPVTLKSDYICMLCETIMGGRYEITTIQKSIIDRCVTELYRPYMEHMRDMPADITCDTTASPTLDDLYELLMRQPEPEAQNIALSLEIYCRGSLDTFAHRTNVDINNRITVYDIKNIGSGMKELGLQVCLNHVWNAIIANHAKGKRTYLYMDEFHILTKTRSSSEFLLSIWKRARKWGGTPTGITQNISDLFKNEAAMTLLNNTEFILMLGQSPIDRANLAELYGISDAQLNYITNSPPGQGLLYTGETIIPFIDHFPKDTELYSIMSSTANERKIV